MRALERDEDSLAGFAFRMRGKKPGAARLPGYAARRGLGLRGAHAAGSPVPGPGPGLAAVAVHARRVPRVKNS